MSDKIAFEYFEFISKQPSPIKSQLNILNLLAENQQPNTVKTNLSINSSHVR